MHRHELRKERNFFQEDFPDVFRQNIILVTRKNMLIFGNRFKPISFQKNHFLECERRDSFEQIWANRRAKDGPFCASLLSLVID